MARIYGHKWTSINNADDGTWLAGLFDVSPVQVAHGLSSLTTGHHEWPPTLPEFRDLCLGYTDEPEGMWQHKSKAYIGLQNYKAIDQLKAQDSVVNEEREKLRKMGILKTPIS